MGVVQQPWLPVSLDPEKPSFLCSGPMLPLPPYGMTYILGPGTSLWSKVQAGPVDAPGHLWGELGRGVRLSSSFTVVGYGKLGGCKWPGHPEA